MADVLVFLAIAAAAGIGGIVIGMLFLAPRISRALDRKAEEARGRADWGPRRSPHRHRRPPGGRSRVRVTTPQPRGEQGLRWISWRRIDGVAPDWSGRMLAWLEMLVTGAMPLLAMAAGIMVLVSFQRPNRRAAR